ncbi:MAG: hypothetical protein GX600_08535 [Dehalococcoidia bacterium]|nr:hypothetical protein [Dehalococcoidia bacterium]
MKTPWPMIRLGEVLTERQEAPTADDLLQGSVPIVAKIGFNDGQIQLRNSVETRTGMILIHPGDLVVSGINAAKGAIAVYRSSGSGPIAATIHYSAYVPDSQRVNIKYLWWLLRSAVFRELLLLHVPGGIKTELKASRLLPIPVPLPPIDEQGRIVARIEELAAKIEDARGLRRGALQTVEALYLSRLSTLMQSLGETYGFQSVGQLIQDAGYGTSVRCDYQRPDRGVPVLRIPNVAGELISQADMKYGVLGESELAKLQLFEGDILVVRTNGSRDLVGRSAVVSLLSEPTAFASYLIRLRLNRAAIEPTFAQLVLKHLRTSGKLFDLARTTAGQYNVSLGRLRSASVPVPPVLVQRDIVAEMDSIDMQLATVRRLQAETAAELDALLPSILDRAFKGELV